MPYQNKSLLQLGRKFASTESIDPSWLGKPFDVAYVGPNASGGLVRDADEARPTSRVCLVQNKTAGNVPPGSLVTLNGTNWPSQILDECATAEVAFGVVDPFLSGNVAADEYCLVIVRGPCKYKLPNASASVTALDVVLPHATEDGRIEPIDATPDNDAEAFFASLTAVGQVFETSDVENALVDGVFWGGHNGMV